jgi:selenide,water dikinase
LAGHLLEICRGSRLGANIEFAKLPIMPGVMNLAKQGYVTGASGRNWSGYGDDIQFAATFGDDERNLLTDPQTSGGLLVACDPSAVDAVLAVFESEGFEGAAVIGEMTSGAAKVTIA